MRTETTYYCEVCGSQHWDAEYALECEASHKCTGSKPKYHKGDLLHYVDPETGTDVYFAFESAEVYWDAEKHSWIYKRWGDAKIPEDVIDLEMSVEERMRHIAAIKAKLEPDYHDISVVADSTEPKFFINAYWWNKKERRKQ